MRTYQFEWLRRVWYREHELLVPDWVEISVHHLGFNGLQQMKT
jgi:hypothetical protein